MVSDPNCWTVLEGWRWNGSQIEHKVVLAHVHNQKLSDLRRTASEAGPLQDVGLRSEESVNILKLFLLALIAFCQRHGRASQTMDHLSYI